MGAAKSSTLQVKFIVDGDGKVVAAFNGMESGADKSSKAIDNLSKELLTLNERLDKNAAKSNQLGRDRAVLDAALKNGLITQEQHNRLLRQSVDRYSEVAAKARIAGAVIGTVFVAGLTAVFRATADAEKVQAQLEARIRSTRGAAGLSVKELNDMAAALQQVTTFDDESIGEAQALLLTFTKIGHDVFPRATTAVLDTATAMGTDLKSAAIQVGKALNDPILGVAALTRVGVQFNEQQKALIKTLVESGHVQQAQGIILTELETQMGGAATAARDTLGGALEGLKNDFENLLEGDSGSAGVRGVTESIREMSATLNDPAVKQGFATITEGILDVSTEILKGIGLLGQYIGKYNEIADIGSGAIPLRQASDAGLQNRLNAVGRTLSNLQRGSVLGNMEALYGQDSALTASDLLRTSGSVQERLKAERTRIIREMTNRNRAAAGMQPLGVPAALDLGAAISGLGKPFSMVGPAPFRLTDFSAPTPDDPDKAKAAAAKALAAAQKAAAAAARERAKAERELREEVEKVVAAHDQFTTSAEDLRAELEGPLAQAQLAYNRQLAEFRDLAKRGEISATDLAAAERDLAEQHEREADAIRKRLDPAADLIKQLDDELRLRTLNNAEARAAIDLANLSVPATKAEAAAIVDRYRALQAQAETADAMDAFRDSSKHAWLEFATGAKSAGDAAKDFFNDLAGELLRLFTDRAWEQLFGSQGSVNGGSAGGGLASLAGLIFGGRGSSNAGLTEEQMYAKSVSAGGLTGGGSGGGFWSTLAGFFGAIFGGNRAAGGETLARHFYRVNEQQPELLEYDGQTLLMMGSRGGRVRPMQPAMAGGNTYNISVGVEGRVDRRTRSQIAAEIEQQSRRARGRNG